MIPLGGLADTIRGPVVAFLGRHALPLFVASGLVTWAMVEHIRAERLSDELAVTYAEAQARFARQAATYAAAAASAADAAASESQRRIDAQERIAREATRQADDARAEAAAAADAAGRLRVRFAALAARSCGGAADHPAAAGASSSAADTARVLADVQRLIDERAGVLAAYADAVRIAGDACASAYDSLTAGAR